MRNRFDEQLEELNSELTLMGALCEEVISLVCKALANYDKELAKTVSPVDIEIDKKERSIESICLKLLLQQQPVAKDLRQVSAALKMITDMERIGDQASDIAEIIQYMNKKITDCDEHLQKMGAATIKMVTESIDAYVKHDIELAEKVIDDDDTVDEYFAEIKKQLITVITESPSEGEYILDVLMIAKYFERIGDHTTNIAEDRKSVV